MGRVALLDINVLVALFDPDHVHHEIAHDWFAEQRADGWSTCPLTENGLVRILSSPSYSPSAERPGAIRSRLRKFTQSGQHTFWPDDISLCDERLFPSSLPIPTSQITDVYLLALARHHNGCLATFDRRIPLKAVAGATTSHLSIVGA
jgi:uncharacterized protein